jgi:hypothetical protein
VITLEALSTIISLAVLWIYICWIYRGFRDDLFRQDLFDLRDELFDLGIAKEIAFDHPAYGLLRSTINGFMRGADNMSLTSLVIFAVAGRPELREAQKSYAQRWEAAANSLPGETRSKLLDIRDRLNGRLIMHVVATSPLTWILIVPVAALALVMMTTEAVRLSVRKKLNAGIEGFDVVGATLGGDCDAPAAA